MMRIWYILAPWNAQVITIHWKEYLMHIPQNQCIEQTFQTKYHVPAVYLFIEKIKNIKKRGEIWNEYGPDKLSRLSVASLYFLLD